MEKGTPYNGWWGCRGSLQKKRSWIEETARNHRVWQGDFQDEGTMGKRGGMAMPAGCWAAPLGGVPTGTSSRNPWGGGLEL